MRIIKRDQKGGSVRIGVENADDLWVLRTVIAPGDLIRGSTERKVKIGSGREEKSSVARKRVTLTIKAEKAEYSPDGSTLRVLGTITDGPEEVPRGEHHSFILVPNEEITITKTEWPAYLLAKLHEATKLDSALLVLLFDREEAKLYGVTRRGVQEVARLKGKVAKKDIDDQHASNFYKELVAALQEHATRGYDHIVAGAPAFWKEYLERELPPELKKKTVMTTISAVEKTAIRELLARPEIAKLLAESSMLKELQLVENVMEALAKERLAYGDEALRDAIGSGNAKEVIVTEHEIAKRRERDEWHALEGLLQTAEASRASVHVLSSDEAQEKVDPLGGIVAIRRW